MLDENVDEGDIINLASRWRFWIARPLELQSSEMHMIAKDFHTFMPSGYTTMASWLVSSFESWVWYSNSFGGWPFPCSAMINGTGSLSEYELGTWINPFLGDGWRRVSRISYGIDWWLGSLAGGSDCCFDIASTVKVATAHQEKVCDLGGDKSCD